MPLSASGQRRFLARTTRLVGLTFLSASFAALILDVPSDLDVLAVTLPLYGLIAAGFTMIGRNRSLGWTATVLLAGVATILLLGADALGGSAGSTVTAAFLLGSAAFPALVVCNLDTPARIITLAVGAALVIAATLITTSRTLSLVETLVSVIVGWSVLVGVAVWLSVSISRALDRIARLGRAHLAERHATETEAQRRQGARLLHDTVLATLTLLAHSGVGVSPDALRVQAGEDARLLRQLRLGGTPMPRSSGAYTLEATETSDLGHTLESVKQRFDRMGLTVSWHGAGRLLLPSDVLDAFLLSLAECLENVRRHSGVSDAEVTITQDDTTVRAMVTDSGVGFDLDQVDSARLGLAESVIARIREVGGRTRLFSAPGSGTTVVLEVPKL
ncbi:sensor histidine kinase [Agreia pratensis]|uniref:Signal transduction histidine kinase n=1 Tax=Agreia pratensis TaxID=150121 RepID=A0A1X7K5A5_9MICO|nr:ATP-binding protein [Agreia pratensis]SMG35398.1 Signal transduction histidine kinase [Agreia pratensis]